MKYLTASIFILVILFSCKKNLVVQIDYAFSETDKKYLLSEIEDMATKDQKYRASISLGTTDPKILAEDKEKRNLPIEEYMAYLQSLKLSLSQKEKDSLWLLQHEVDYANYKRAKKIIHRFGYPSIERLGVKGDRFFPILLHPPIQVDSKFYLDEMAGILKKEVLQKRMNPKQYAQFHDNITVKVLNAPSLYGTMKTFDLKTMSEKPAKIQNLKSTNLARVKIGLPALQEGEYQIID